MWRVVCEPHYPEDHQDRAEAALAAESALWELARTEHRSATIFSVLERAGIEPTGALVASYLREWEPHTFTDQEGITVLRQLRARRIKIGVLSNTLWPRSWHEDVFRRDGVLDLIDGRSEERRGGKEGGCQRRQRRRMEHGEHRRGCVV